jgi:protein-tyrosine phosphatase
VSKYIELLVLLNGVVKRMKTKFGVVSAVLLVMCGLTLITLHKAHESKKNILFVCTGNYYRSRFAEAYFNWKARDAALPWIAVSRGLQPKPGKRGMDPDARQQLKLRGVPIGWSFSGPKKLTEQDLLASDYVVVLDEEEHRPMMEQQFPGLAVRNLHYWHIRDVKEACAAMAPEIDSLVVQFKRGEENKENTENLRPILREDAGKK